MKSERINMAFDRGSFMGNDKSKRHIMDEPWNRLTCHLKTCLFESKEVVHLAVSEKVVFVLSKPKRKKAHLRNTRHIFLPYMIVVKIGIYRSNHLVPSPLITRGFEKESKQLLVFPPTH
jgi:hypothetical protein